jgi:hypothetical protein
MAVILTNPPAGPAPARYRVGRQGTTVEAEAKVGDVVRKISVFQGWPQVPSFFDFAVLSAGGLTKTD